MTSHRQIHNTFILVVFGWIIFRAENIGQAWAIISQVFSSSFLSIPDAKGITGFSVAICVMLVIEWLQRDRQHALDVENIPWWPVRTVIYFFIFFLIVTLGGHSENFIYFQF